MKVKLDRCPSVDMLARVLAEELDWSELSLVEDHLEECEQCQVKLEGMTNQSKFFKTHTRIELALDVQPQEDFLNRLKKLPMPLSLRSSNPELTVDLLPPRTTDRTGRFDDLANTRLGQYQIKEKLGKGNMGVVYKAIHHELEKAVALKILSGPQTNEVSIARFKNEARIMSRLEHPNIVAAYDAGQMEGKYFLVMTFVNGVDLGRLLQIHGRLSIPDACELIRQAAIGLQHAFEQGMVHRDLKPSNIMLARTGVVKVLDLGIARSFSNTKVDDGLTATGAVIGTADYLAPEQWENPRTVDIRADIYSLGCTLYHLLAGKPPFSGPEYRSLMAMMRGHVEHPVPPINKLRPDVPVKLSALLERMLAKHSEDRYATPGEVADAITPFTAGADLNGLIRSTDHGAVHQTTNHVHVENYPANLSRKKTVSSKRDSKPGRWYMGAVVLVSTVFVVLGLWLIKTNYGQQQSSLSVERMTISQSRDEDKSFGDISVTAEPVLESDYLKVKAKWTSPGYCYLIAFNPDGTEQLCCPEDKDHKSILYPQNKAAPSMSVKPERTTELRFPKEEYFVPGMTGLQVFVLIVSKEPLSPYAEWRATIGEIPWKKSPEIKQKWRWSYNGKDFGRYPDERGDIVNRSGVPDEFRQLCEFLRSRPNVDCVHAWAFPVSKK